MATALTKKMRIAPAIRISGKWNFHYYDGTIESLNTDAVILDLSFLHLTGCQLGIGRRMMAD